MSEHGVEIVLDNGSFSIKAGFSGQEAPKVEIPSFAGTVSQVQKRKSSFDSEAKSKSSCTSLPHTLFGYEAIEAGEKDWNGMSIHHVVSAGHVQHWDHMEDIYDHIFLDDMKINPESRPFMFVSPPRQSKKQAQVLREVMFEGYGAGLLHDEIAGVLSLYALGEMSGCVLDIGSDLTSCVPVYEGYVLEHAIGVQRFAGENLTSRLDHMLRDSGFYFGSFNTAASSIVRKIKEDVCYVANPLRESRKLNFRRLRTIFDENYDVMKYYTLPDGKKIKVYMERFQTAEVLFDPSEIEQDDEMLGLQYLVKKSIDKCDLNIRPTLFDNIVLAGGTSMLPGIDVRLQDELNLISPKKLNIRVQTPEDRRYLPWVGGAVFASLPIFYEMAVSKSEYLEFGPSYRTDLSKGT